MTIGVNNRNDAVGSGSTATYPYGFKIFAATDLRVTVRDPDTDAETTLTYPTHYSVTGVGVAAGGNIVLAGTGNAWQDASGYLDTDWVLTVRRVRPLTQATDIRNQGSFRASVHEDAFDHLMMVDQQQQDELDRSMKLRETVDADLVSALLPIPAASTLLGWNDTGDEIINYVAGDIAPDILVSAFMETLLDDATAAEARATLGVALSGYMFGCVLSNNASDATNDIDITAGSWTDSTGVQLMTLPAMTKQLDAGWAAGSAAGFRNSGAAITDTTYHIYAVCKALGADPDYYAHTSATIATVIAALQAEAGGSAYIYARRIASITRAAGAIRAFRQTGDRFDYYGQVADVSVAANTAVTARTLSVPVGIKVEAIIRVLAKADNAGHTLVSDPDNGSVAGDGNNSVLYNATALAGDYTSAVIRVVTNTSAQINSDGNGTNAVISINTMGYIDTRGRLA